MMLVYAMYCAPDSSWYEDMDDDEAEYEVLKHFGATVARTHEGAAMISRSIGYEFDETDDEYEDWTITRFLLTRISPAGNGGETRE